MSHIDYYQCDRCGKQFGDEDYGASIEDRRKGTRHDLCKNCCFQLRAWLTSEADARTVDSSTCARCSTGPVL